MFSANTLVSRYVLLLVFALALHNRVSAQQEQPPVKQWDKAIGGDAYDLLQALQQTSDGGYLLGGYSYSGVSGDKTQPNRGDADFWVVKLDAQGVKQWDRTLGGVGEERLMALQQTADGGYLLGGYSNSAISGDKSQASRGEYDYWLVKLDSQGNKKWDYAFGGTGSDYLQKLQLTSDGGCLLAGTSNSGDTGDKTQASRGFYDYWLVKVDAQGTKQWDRTFGGNGSDNLAALQLTPDQGYVVGGSSLSNRSGDKTQANRGGEDYWLVKLDAQGMKQWDRTFGGDDHEHLSDLQLTQDGGYMLGGSSRSIATGDKTQTTQGGFDYWVVKLDAAGVQQWDYTFGGNLDDLLYALQPTQDGGYVLAGMSYSGFGGDKTEESRGNSDYWLLKLDSEGTKQWDRTIGGNLGELLNVLQLTRDGGYLVAGASGSTPSGERTQPSRGGFDYWLVKLGPSFVTTTAPWAATSGFTVYPNPAHASLTLHLPSQAIHTGLQFSLLDATGRLVLRQPLAVTGDDVLLEIGQHPAGLYLLRVEGPQGVVATQRVLLE